MAQLREIYDGKYSKSFGTGETIDWTGKITVLAGATYAIHTLKQSYTSMGERFIFYNMIQPDREEAAGRTMDNQEEGKMAEHRKLLSVKFNKYITSVLNNIPKEFPKIDKRTRADLISLAELVTRARSSVERNWRSPQQEIVEVHPPEMPTRFAGQLQTIYNSLKIINYQASGNFDLFEDDIHILNKLTLDSITKMRRVIMQELSRYEIIETAGLATKLNLPTTSVRRHLEDLTALEIADRYKGGGSKGDKWNIKPKYRDLMARFEGIKMEGGELTGDNTRLDPLEDELNAIVAEAEAEQAAAKEKEESFL